MKFKFKQDTHLEIVVGLDKDDEPIFEDEFFPKGEVHEVDLLGYREKSIDIQFGDGDCCYGLDLGLIEIIKLSKKEKKDAQ